MYDDMSNKKADPAATGTALKNMQNSHLNDTTAAGFAADCNNLLHMTEDNPKRAFGNLRQFHLSPIQESSESKLQASERFRQAIEASGITAPEMIIADGQIHRFSTNGKRGDKAGWYVFHDDGIVPAGAFGCWRSDISENWCGKAAELMTPAERSAYQQQVQAITKQREAELANRRADAAAEAMRRWEAALPAPADHPYLAQKGIPPHGVRVEGDLLLVPLRDAEGNLHSLQEIALNGAKRFIPGGRVQGCFFLIGVPEGVLVVCEGFATGASIHEATGYAVACAMSASNLKPVAEALSKKYPKLPIILAADDDHMTTGNPGITNASEAAKAIGGYLAKPDFGEGRGEKDTDFNDLHKLAGLGAVKACIDAATPALTAWPEPQPLSAKVEPVPYPLDALPKTIRAAVEEVAAFVKAPIPLVASSALAAVSLAIQSHYDVRRMEELEGPVGLFLLTLADSGERKSTCDRFFTKVIRAYEEEQAELARPALKDYNAKLAAWKAKCKGVTEKITQLAKENKPTLEMEMALRDLEHEEPEAPRVPRLLYADATPEALAYSLAKKWPSGGVVSAEAGSVFGSHAMGKDSVMRNLSLLNQLWDGSSFPVDRKTGESFNVRGARLTVALQVQEPTLREFFAQSGVLARGIGFLARCLIAWPESTQGTRMIDPSAPEGPSAWPHLSAFNRRITEILNQPAPMDEAGALTPPTIPMTPEAKRAWVEYHNAIESELSSGGELCDVRDVASKSADNAARLAALFQIFEGGGGAIGLEAFEGASRIAAWHLHETRRFFGELALPQELADAVRLDSWLIEHCKRERTHMVSTREAQRLGPVRKKERLTTALRELEELDRVLVVQDGRRKIIKVNPSLVVTP